MNEYVKSRNDYKNDRKNDSKKDNRNYTENDSETDCKNDSENDSKNYSENDSEKNNRNNSQNDSENYSKNDSENYSKNYSKNDSENYSENDSKNDSENDSKNDKRLIGSGFIDADEILNLNAADRTLAEVLAALDACCVVLARHVHAVLIVLVADDARVGHSLVTYVRCLYFATVGGAGPEFKYELVHQLFVPAGFSFQRQPLPRPIGSSHVLDVVLVLDGEDRGVHVAEVLVIGEIDGVVLLPADGDLVVAGDFHEGSLGGPFDDFEGEDSIEEVGLELV